MMLSTNIRRIYGYPMFSYAFSYQLNRLNFRTMMDLYYSSAASYDCFDIFDSFIIYDACRCIPSLVPPVKQAF